jgi:hypothetical protein
MRTPSVALQLRASAGCFFLVMNFFTASTAWERIPVSGCQESKGEVLPLTFLTRRRFCANEKAHGEEKRSPWVPP